MFHLCVIFKTVSVRIFLYAVVCTEILQRPSSSSFVFFFHFFSRHCNWEPTTLIHARELKILLVVVTVSYTYILYRLSSHVRFSLDKYLFFFDVRLIIIYRIHRQ